jgi:putative flavoprotein involved in K+ transport
LPATHSVQADAHGALQQLARDGVRLLGRLTAVDDTKQRFAADLPDNIRHADDHAARFRNIVGQHIARTGMVAPPPDADPAERPGTARTAPRWCSTAGPNASARSSGPPDSGRISTGSTSRCAHATARWHRRGITVLPGLYVVGFPWLSTRGSGILYGVDADAGRIAQHAAAALGAARPEPAIAS